MAGPSSDDLYGAFSRWSASIGCPQPGPDLFSRLARGNGAQFLRLLVQYVQPADSVDRVRHALRLHDRQQQPIGEHHQERPYHHDKLAFMRRSHTATVHELDYLNRTQAQMARSIRDLSAAAVILNDACRRSRRDHLQPIERITESVRSVVDDDDPHAAAPIVSLDDRGRLATADPVRAALQALYNELVDDHGKSPTDPLPFAPNAALVDDLIRIAQQRLARLGEYRNTAESSSSSSRDVTAPPMSLSELMQESREAHIERFFDALDKLNLARELRRRAGPESLPLRQVGLRARLDCLQRHIERCEGDLAAAQSDHDRLHDALDAISRLESDRERLHGQLAAMIRANRDLRSGLALTQARCRRTQAVLESAVTAMQERVARLGRCFEIDAAAALRRTDSEFEDAWRPVGRSLGIHTAQVCDPVAILSAVRARSDTLCALQISHLLGEPLLTAAKQIDSGDIEGLTERCHDLHANGDRAVLDLDAMLHTLERLDGDCASYRELLDEWWEQPGQYTVPDEQRSGLNIRGWIERRRKLVAELRPDPAGRQWASTSPM